MFGFKKSVNDIAAMISKLSEDEKTELMKMLNGEEMPDEEESGNAPEPSVTDAENGNEGTPETARAPETNNADGAEDGNAGDANMPVDTESDGDETPESETVEASKDNPAEDAPAEPQVAETQESDEAVDNAQSARIDALESRLQALEELLQKKTDEDESRDFGLQSHAPEGAEDNSRYSAVMRGYAGDKAGQYH